MEENLLKKEKIEEQIDNAIEIMNDSFKFDVAVEFIETALRLCDSKKDLMYYQILLDVVNGLSFKFRNIFTKTKIENAYSLLFNFIANKFKNIINFNYDINNDDEALLLNSICVGLYNRFDELIAVFINSSNAGIWGLVGIMALIKKEKNNFMKAHTMIAFYSSIALKNYTINDITVKDNIIEFDKFSNKNKKWMA